MKTALLYGTTRGSTERVAHTLKNDLAFPFDIINVKNLDDLSTLKQYDSLLFLCPTYGDKEPQEDIEQFLIRFDLDLTDKYFSVCAIGTYEGYEQFEPSCGRITSTIMTERGGAQILPLLCVDSLPGIDTRAIKNWCDRLNDWYDKQSHNNPARTAVRAL